MRAIHTIARVYLCRLLTTTQNKGYSIKYYVACVFGAPDVKCFWVKQYYSREKPVQVHAPLCSDRYSVLKSPLHV